MEKRIILEQNAFIMDKGRQNINTNKMIRIILLFIMTTFLSFILLTFINDKIALICLIAILAVMLTVNIYLKNRKKRLRKKIISQEQKTTSRIISSKIFRQSKLVLQLHIQEPGNNYISGLVINLPDEGELDNYTQGSTIDICINPKDMHDIFIPDQRLETISESSLIWGAFLIIFIPISLLITFAALYDRGVLTKKPEYFQDSKIIKLNNQKYQLWELKIKYPHEIIINIYDPSINKKIISIKDKKDYVLNPNFHLSIIQQNDKVFILDDLYNPFLDVYDARTFQKIMDIRQFEQSNPILKDSIVSIRNYKRSRIVNEDIFEFFVENGNRYFYNITQNQFFKSEKEAYNYVYQKDSTEMANHMYAFALLYVSEGEKYLLSLVEAVSKNNRHALIQYAGDPSINIQLNDYPVWEEPFYKYEKPTLKTFKDTLQEPTFAYFDFELALIEHQVISGISSVKQFTGFDKNGKIVFSIEQNQIPNVKKMLENNFLLSNKFNYKTIRDNNYFIITFSYYGSICIDLKTGKTVWKFEPSFENDSN